jgi:hypothetical protein
MGQNIAFSIEQNIDQTSQELVLVDLISSIKLTSTELSTEALRDLY